MANYTSKTSDKSRDKAIKYLCIGGLGFHMFYVGRIKAGMVRFIIGLLCWGIIIYSLTSKEFLVALCVLLVLLVINIIDLFKLFLGTFKDNVGDYLRQ